VTQCSQLLSVALQFRRHRLLLIFSNNSSNQYHLIVSTYSRVRIVTPRRRAHCFAIDSLLGRCAAVTAVLSQPFCQSPVVPMRYLGLPASSAALWSRSRRSL
jgi:hypothetical protein